MQRLLKKYFFMPFKERGHGTWGYIATFLSSGLIHSYIFISVGVYPALSVFLFFLLQVVLLDIERRIGVREWQGHLARRAWVFGALALSLPFVVEPLFASLGGI